mmetsp:Transcript_4414/g.12730  ORF Transcript_4414/g.12730 Transcript_4414/m.12730 type:complete len:270 (+) Transcript_4414:764-1573(+)
MQVDPSVCVPGDARADHIHDADRQGLVFLRDLDGLKSVRGLAALRDRDDDVLGEDQRPSVSELARVLDLYRQLGQALHGIFCNQPGVRRGTASSDDNPLSIRHAVQRALGAGAFKDLFQAAELDLPRISAFRKAASHCIAKCVRLIHDLLQHKVGIAAFLNLLKGHLQSYDRIVVRHSLRALWSCQGLSHFLQVPDLVARTLQLDQLPISQVHDILRMLDNGRGIARQHVLADANAEDQRRALASADKEVRFVLEHEDDAVGPLDEPQC